LEEGQGKVPATANEWGEGAGSRPRVLLIDFDVELAEILSQLLEEGDTDVVLHSCPSDEGCRCVERVRETSPDLILVNIAHPDGWYADLRGWHCLERLRADGAARSTRMMAYTVFDHYALREMAVEPGSIGVKVYTGLCNPGHLADEVTRAVRLRSAA
jgi:CheY-like chemotaxis protein